MVYGDDLAGAGEHREEDQQQDADAQEGVD